jgi:hypothetical protein
MEIQDSEPKKQKKDPKVKDPKPSRTLDTMFRTTMSNHVHLTVLADRKAALMISMNSIIISIMVSFLVNKFEEYPNLMIPTGLMALVSLLTITFAILSTKPNTNQKKASDLPVDLLSLDLLFFGDYLVLSPEEYKQHMKALIVSDDQLYDSLIKSIYSQGKVISRKFRLLKIAYNVFMIGFPLVVLCYLAAIYFS